MFLSTLLRKKLTDFILLNGYSCNASGLYYGKAGIALALFELARFYKSDYLEHHAFEILQESLLTKTQNIDFANGLSGIGYSLQYLIRQNYIDTNYNELFGDQHRKIIQTISRQNFIFSNFQEIFGIYLYIESNVEDIYAKNEGTEQKPSYVIEIRNSNASVMRIICEDKSTYLKMLNLIGL